MIVELNPVTISGMEDMAELLLTAKRSEFCGENYMLACY